MSTIIYIKKEALFPAFGFSRNVTIYVRDDLPKIVQKFVSKHELYHLQDKSTNWLWREIKANSYGFKKCPIGFIYTMILSLNPYRIKMYIQRFKQKGNFIFKTSDPTL